MMPNRPNRNIGSTKRSAFFCVKFEVPHRQQIASDPDSALFVRSGPFHHFLRPVNAELVSGGPFLCSSTALGTRNGLLRYATHLQRHSVYKIGAFGTEGIFGTRNGLLRYGICARCKNQASVYFPDLG